MQNKNGLILYFSYEFWVEGLRLSETISDQKCYLYCSMRLSGEAQPVRTSLPEIVQPLHGEESVVPVFAELFQPGRALSVEDATAPSRVGTSREFRCSSRGRRMIRRGLRFQISRSKWNRELEASSKSETPKLKVTMATVEGAPLSGHY